MKHYRALDKENIIDLDEKINELADQGWTLIPETFYLEIQMAKTWTKLHYLCVMEKGT